jgi:hypothetical protein
MKYTVDKGLGAMIAIQVGSGIEKLDLKICDDGTLVQILYFWTLSIVLSLSKKSHHVYFSKHNVSDTGFCLRNVVFCEMNRMAFLDKDRTIDNVQKHNICALKSL